MKKNLIVKKYAFLGSDIHFQKVLSRNNRYKYAPNESLITANIKKFDKTDSVHNVIRKN